jgi:hypothetical protein
MKYTTLAQLRRAYKSGELHKDASPLTIDNDCAHVYAGNEDDSELVFRGGMPEDLLREALTLLGIPWDNA